MFESDGVRLYHITEPNFIYDLNKAPDTKPGLSNEEKFCVI